MAAREMGELALADALWLCELLANVDGTVGSQLAYGAICAFS